MPKPRALRTRPRDAGSAAACWRAAARSRPGSQMMECGDGPSTRKERTKRPALPGLRAGDTGGGADDALAHHVALAAEREDWEEVGEGAAGIGGPHRSSNSMEMSTVSASAAEEDVLLPVGEGVGREGGLRRLRATGRGRRCRRGGRGISWGCQRASAGGSCCRGMGAGCCGQQKNVGPRSVRRGGG